jgi:glycine oxidase
MKVGIVGAGVMGRVLAETLLVHDHHQYQHQHHHQKNSQKRNYHIAIFDSDETRGEQSCAYVAGGMIAPFCECDRNNALIFELGQSAPRYWKKISEASGNALGFYGSGTYAFAHQHDAEELRFLQKKLGLFHLNSPENCHALTSQELGDRFPEQKNFQALHLPQEACLYPRSYLAYSNQKILPQLALAQFGKKVSVAPKQIEREHFEWVIDCRGLGAKSEVENLRGVRGEIFNIACPQVDLPYPLRILHPRLSLFILPRGNSIYTVGATEIESEDESPITVLSLLEMLRILCSFDPRFAYAHLLETQTRLRPTLSNHLPAVIIGEGSIRINGLYRHGFLLAPQMAADVENFLRTGKRAHYFTDEKPGGIQ